MKMFPYSRAGALSKVHPEVDTFGTIYLLQRRDGALGERHHFRQLLGSCASNCVAMLVRRNHEVAGRIWKQIENDEIVVGPKEDETLGIAHRVFTDAEDAPAASSPA